MTSWSNTYAGNCRAHFDALAMTLCALTSQYVPGVPYSLSFGVTEVSQIRNILETLTAVC